MVVGPIEMDAGEKNDFRGKKINRLKKCKQ